MTASDSGSDNWAESEWSKRTWEDLQLDQARIKGPTKAAVRRVLDAWWAFTGVNEVDVEVALDAFVKLANGSSLLNQIDRNAVWEQVKPGRVWVRDQVRVRADAYQGDAGRAHNGRHGRVVAVRYGDIVVRYEDGVQPKFEAVHHAPTALERRVE